MSNKPFTSRNIFLLLIFSFLFTRLYNLTLLPIFTDESIYIYWAKYIATYQSNWFMSLTDGKPPLFIWVIALFLKLFPSGMYLAAGRLVSVIAGAITIIGVYKLSLLLFKSKKIALFAVLLCIVSPFMLFYERLALYDSLLSAALVWSVYFALKTSFSLKIKDAILWGLTLGVALLIKPPALIFLLLTPICFLLLIEKTEIRKSFKKTFFLLVIAVVVAEIISALQRLSENYHLMAIKNQQFQLSFSELIADPFIIFGKNIQELFSWIFSYYTFPIFIMGVIALGILLLKNFKIGLVLFILWFVPILTFSLVGKIIFPRYILFTTPYFLIALAGGSKILFDLLRIKALQKIVMAAAIMLSLRFHYYLLTNPIIAPLPQTDYNQYVSSAYSGYGLDTVFRFLDKELDSGPQIMLVTQGKFGLLPYAFRLKYWDEKRMMFYQAWLSEKLDVDVYSLAKSAKVYIVMWQDITIPEKFPFREVLRVEKPGGKNPIILAVPKELHE